MSEPAVRHVAVFSLGGTIAMTSGRGGGVVPALTAADLVAAVPGLAESGIAVHVNDFRTVPGACLGFDDLAELVVAAGRAVADGADGVVITQGTDTIEETAFALDLLWDFDTPLVVTGAMRNPTLAGADGPANLLAAVTVATTPAARGLGCLVVLNDEIHAARWVRKTHTSNTAAFRSPNTGPVGLLAEGRARILNRTTRHGLDLAVPVPVTARTALLPVVLDHDDLSLRALASGLDGFVIAGFGVGHVPAALVPALTELASAMPVVLASRVGSGPVLERTYGFAGSESDLLSRGLISAAMLDGYKARVLLHLLLASGVGRDGIIKAFETVGASEAILDQVG